MRVVVIGSGSQGNTTLFEAGGSRVLVDAGLSLRELRKRLGLLGLADARFDALLITHSHADHAQHAARWARGLKVPVYASARTRQEAEAAFAGVEVRDLRSRGMLQVGAIQIRTLPLPHDVAQVGVIANHRGHHVGLVTDLGCVPASLAASLSQCETVLLESNHCTEMMEIAPYPSFLKRRIRGDRGHLSNRQAAGLIRDLPNLRRLVLMHLSQKANSPRRAEQVAREALGERDVELVLAHQDKLLDLAPLAPPTSRARPTNRAPAERQLALGF